jgi:hypothetical protein
MNISVTLSEQEIMNIVRERMAQSGVVLPAGRAFTIKAKMHRSRSGVRELVLNLDPDASREGQVERDREEAHAREQSKHAYHMARKDAYYADREAMIERSTAKLTPPPMSAAQMQALVDAMDQYTSHLGAPEVAPSFDAFNGDADYIGVDVAADPTTFSVALTGVSEQLNITDKFKLTRALRECVSDGAQGHTAELGFGAGRMGLREALDTASQLMDGGQPIVYTSGTEDFAYRVRGLLLDYGFHSVVVY